MKIRIKKLHPNAVIPKYSKEGDAGMDLTVTSIYSEDEYHITYGFGIAMEIPEGYVGLVFPRSSIRDFDLTLSNSVGVIDSGYRGEIQGTFKKTIQAITYNPHKIYMGGTIYSVGERAAQIMVMPIPYITFVETNELSDSVRGYGGFGSTGI